jgi:AcrR family transcriptional regulator
MTMARKRSRSATEQRFQDAVLNLIADSGCAKLGVNAVAELAGSDKVLIYRYFGNFEGLLHRVAESRTWLPSTEELCSAISTQPQNALADLARLISRHVRTDPATHQLSLWRHAQQNPLTKQYTSEWKKLWRELPQQLGTDLGYQARKKWDNACALLALTVEAELAGEAIDLRCLDAISAQLEAPSAKQTDDAIQYDEDILPTNLL